MAGISFVYYKLEGLNIFPNQTKWQNMSTAELSSLVLHFIYVVLHPLSHLGIIATQFEPHIFMPFETYELLVVFFAHQPE